jgi:hypothetical protein
MNEEGDEYPDSNDGDEWKGGDEGSELFPEGFDEPNMSEEGKLEHIRYIYRSLKKDLDPWRLELFGVLKTGGGIPLESWSVDYDKRDKFADHFPSYDLPEGEPARIMFDFFAIIIFFE